MICLLRNTEQQKYGWTIIIKKIKTASEKAFPWCKFPKEDILRNDFRCWLKDLVNTIRYFNPTNLSLNDFDPGKDRKKAKNPKVSVNSEKILAGREKTERRLSNEYRDGLECKVNEYILTRDLIQFLNKVFMINESILTSSFISISYIDLLYKIGNH